MPRERVWSPRSRAPAMLTAATARQSLVSHWCLIPTAGFWPARWGVVRHLRSVPAPCPAGPQGRNSLIESEVSGFSSQWLVFCVLRSDHGGRRGRKQEPLAQHPHLGGEGREGAGLLSPCGRTLQISGKRPSQMTGWAVMSPRRPGYLRSASRAPLGLSRWGGVMRLFGVGLSLGPRCGCLCVTWAWCAFPVGCAGHGVGRILGWHPRPSL